MRRILLSKRWEFSYEKSQPSSLGYAIKKLGALFDGMEKKEKIQNKVTVSNDTLKTEVRKARAS